MYSHFEKKNTSQSSALLGTDRDECEIDFSECLKLHVSAFFLCL